MISDMQYSEINSDPILGALYQNTVGILTIRLSPPKKVSFLR